MGPGLLEIVMVSEYLNVCCSLLFVCPGCRVKVWHRPFLAFVRDIFLHFYSSYIVHPSYHMLVALITRQCVDGMVHLKEYVAGVQCILSLIIFFPPLRRVLE